MRKPIFKNRLYIFGIVGIIILLFFIVWFATPLILKITGFSGIDSGVFFVNRLFIWIALLLLWIYAKNLECQKLLLWPEQKKGWLFSIGASVAILILIFFGNVLISHIINLFTHEERSRKFYEIVSLFKNNIPLLVFTVATAAITEELIFRGYIQPRLQRIFKNPVIAVLSTSVLFGLVHLSYGTWAQFIVPFFIGLVFSLFYWKFRNIKILIVCHFLWDLFGLLAAINYF